LDSKANRGLFREGKNAFVTRVTRTASAHSDIKLSKHFVLPPKTRQHGPEAPGARVTIASTQPICPEVCAGPIHAGAFFPALFFQPGFLPAFDFRVRGVSGIAANSTL
jgi:hypothetical protein